MSPQQDWSPRISVATTEEQFFAVQKAIPWGMRDKLFRKFADELVRISTTHGPMALALLDRQGFTVTINPLKEKTDVNLG